MQPIEELKHIALGSRKFREWRPSVEGKPQKGVLDSTGDSFVDVGGSWHSGPEPKPRPNADPVVTEKHYTPLELGEAWGLSDDTIRKIFQSEPGVLSFGSHGSRKGRRYITIRIPESVAIRVHRRLSAKPGVVE